MGRLVSLPTCRARRTAMPSARIPSRTGSRMNRRRSCQSSARQASPSPPLGMSSPPQRPATPAPVCFAARRATNMSAGPRKRAADRCYTRDDRWMLQTRGCCLASGVDEGAPGAVGRSRMRSLSSSKSFETRRGWRPSRFSAVHADAANSGLYQST